MDLSRISGVTFDLWETLFMDDPQLDRRRDQLRCKGLHDVLLEHGVFVDLEDLAKGLAESSAWLANTWKTGRQVPTIDQISYILRFATKESTLDLLSDEKVVGELEEIYAGAGLITPPKLNVEAVSVLQCLRERGYKIGLICNTGRGPGRILRQLMDNIGILDYFDATIFSDEVGWGKPDRRIFLVAAAGLGLPLEEILHVGDNPDTDVRGAEEAGMKAILFDYEVPVGFREQPGSLFALTRTSGSVTASEIGPDSKIRSLNEVLDLLPD